MNARAVNLLLSAAASLLFAGCLQGTARERAASFSPYVDARVDHEAITNFLRSRTALLITGGHLAITHSASEPDALIYHYQASTKKMEFGSATAVDRRGYFITAAHCLGSEPPYLVFGRGSQSHTERGTIVWRGDSSRRESDLAVLYVPHAIDRAFEWAADVKVGDRVVAVGPNYEHPPDIKVVCFAGSVLECRASSASNSRQISIFHNAPAHKGDSGGPLVAVDGRLLAINVAAAPRFSFLHPLGKKRFHAMRPDLAWLYEIIDEHAIAQGASRAAP